MERNSIGFKTANQAKNAVKKTRKSTKKQPEIPEELELIIDSIESSEYSFEAEIKDQLDKHYFMIMTQFEQAPLDAKKRLLDDFRTATITHFKLMNKKND